MKSVKEFFKYRVIPLCNGFNCAVRQISYPTGNAHFAGRVSGPCPKPDSLNFSVNNAVYFLHLEPTMIIEAVIVVICDDYMVQNPDVEACGRFSYAVGQHDVLR